MKHPGSAVTKATFCWMKPNLRYSNVRGTGGQKTFPSLEIRSLDQHRKVLDILFAKLLCVDMHKRHLLKVNTNGLKSVSSIFKADRDSSFVKVKLPVKCSKSTKSRAG